ncbi:MAG TPA: hypothetical protein VGT99_09730 [Gammaproteobacteria bacterium]|nr:hypothetical protein [Gammaproteobacteria bacterium]
MNDLDPNFLLPLWQALVAYFRRYQPLVQAEQHIYGQGRREARP